MTPKNKIARAVQGEHTFIKGVSLMGFANEGNLTAVDVSRGKLIRIRPLSLDSQYDREKLNVWKMEARGQVFQPDLKILLPPYGLAYKKRVYSPNRILYPLKRVDWDPSGERHPE